MTLNERALSIITEALNHGTITFLNENPDENITLTLKPETILNLAKNLSSKEEIKPKTPSFNLPSDMSFTFIGEPPLPIELSSEILPEIKIVSNYSDDPIDELKKNFPQLKEVSLDGDENQLILPFKHEGK
jgi:hypothetical protein